jgi:hypothetical protein
MGTGRKLEVKSQKSDVKVSQKSKVRSQQSRGTKGKADGQ